MTIATTLVPVVVAWVGTLLIKYTKTSDNLNALLKLVDAAVVFAEKMGVVKALTGNEQFQVALNFVQSHVKSLGITNADEALIKSLIEQSWAKQREQLNAIYDSTKRADTQQQLADSLKEVQAQKDQLTKEKADLEKQKEQVKSLVNGLSQAINDTKDQTPQDQTEIKPDNPNVGKNSDSNDGGTK